MVDLEHVQILLVGLISGVLLEAYLDNYVKPWLVRRIRTEEDRARRRARHHVRG